MSRQVVVMSSARGTSSRQEALNAILQVRQQMNEPMISADNWSRIVTAAWQQRVQSDDRQSLRRELREILMDVVRERR